MIGSFSTICLETEFNVGISASVLYIASEKLARKLGDLVESNRL